MSTKNMFRRFDYCVNSSDKYGHDICTEKDFFEEDRFSAESDFTDAGLQANCLIGMIGIINRGGVDRTILNMGFKDILGISALLMPYHKDFLENNLNALYTDILENRMYQNEFKPFLSIRKSISKNIEDILFALQDKVYNGAIEAIEIRKKSGYHQQQILELYNKIYNESGNKLLTRGVYVAIKELTDDSILVEISYDINYIHKSYNVDKDEFWSSDKWLVLRKAVEDKIKEYPRMDIDKVIFCMVGGADVDFTKEGLKYVSHSGIRVCKEGDTSNTYETIDFIYMPSGGCNPRKLSSIKAGLALCLDDWFEVLDDDDYEGDRCLECSYLLKYLANKKGINISEYENLYSLQRSLIKNFGKECVSKLVEEGLNSFIEIPLNVFEEAQRSHKDGDKKVFTDSISNLFSVDSRTTDKVL